MKNILKSFGIVVLLLGVLFAFGAIQSSAQSAPDTASFQRELADANDIGWNTLNDGWPFTLVQYLSNGLFTVTSSCNTGAGGSAPDGIGGLFLVSATGGVLDRRDVCNDDEGGRIFGEQGFNPGALVHPAGNNRFVVQGQDSHPARLYEYSGSTVRFVSRAYDADDIRDNTKEIAVSPAGGSGGAYANGFYFETARNSQTGKTGIAVYDIPSFNQVDFIESLGTGDTPPRPIIGVGSFILVERTQREFIGGRTRGSKYTDVYRVSSGGNLEFVQELGRFWVLQNSFDTSDPSRVILLTTDPTPRYEGTVEVVDYEFYVYRQNESGLSLETRFVKKARDVATISLSLSGDTLVYLDGELNLVVEKIGESTIPVEQVSYCVFSSAENCEQREVRFSSAALSPNGNIVASVDRGQFLGLFTLGDTVGGPDTPPDITPRFPTTTPSDISNLNYYLDISRIYLDLLRALFNASQ